MTKVVLDASTGAKLSGLAEPVELCDESGRRLGYFHPALPADKMQELMRDCPFSEEELERRRQERTGRPLEEILADLGAT